MWVRGVRTRVGCSSNVHEQITNEFMFSSVRVQFTKFCPVCIPFMNTCVQFMFSSRKKYVNTKRFSTVIVLFSCFRTDKFDTRCSAALQPRRTGHPAHRVFWDPIRHGSPRSLRPARRADRSCIVHPFQPERRGSDSLHLKRGGLLPSKTLFSNLHPLVARIYRADQPLDSGHLIRRA